MISSLTMFWRRSLFLSRTPREEVSPSTLLPTRILMTGPSSQDSFYSARSLHLVCTGSSSGGGYTSTRGVSPVPSGTWVIYVLRFPHHCSYKELSLLQTG